MDTAARSQHYHPAIKSLHWLIAVLVIAQIALGFLQIGTADNNEQLYHAVNLAHVNLGFTLLLLVLIRLGVRLYTPLPAALPGTPRWDAALARFSHRLLYLLLICQPIVGLLVTDTQGYPLIWLGIIPIWDPIGNSPLRDILLPVHTYLAWAIVAVVVLHISGALYHRVVLRDETIARIT